MGWRLLLALWGLLGLLRSEPTVWDGDPFDEYLAFLTEEGSEPTVWDGDDRGFIKGDKEFLCSEPTVWDGDIKLCNDYISVRCVLSPPCGMATPQQG